MICYQFIDTDTSIKVISSRYCCRCQGGLILVLVSVTRRSILSTPEVICPQYWHQYEDDLLSVLIPLSRWSVLRTGTGTKVIGSCFLFTMPSISYFRERDTGNGTDMRTRHGRSVQVPGIDRATREMRSIPILILKSTSVKLVGACQRLRYKSSWFGSCEGESEFTADDKVFTKARVELRTITISNLRSSHEYQCINRGLWTMLL